MSKDKERSDFVMSAEDSHKMFLGYLKRTPKNIQLALQNGGITLEEATKLLSNE